MAIKSETRGHKVVKLETAEASVPTVLSSFLHLGGSYTPPDQRFEMTSPVVIRSQPAAGQVSPRQAGSGGPEMTGRGRGRARTIVKPIRTTIWAAAELGLLTEDDSR